MLKSLLKIATLMSISLTSIAYTINIPVNKIDLIKIMDENSKEESDDIIYSNFNVVQKNETVLFNNCEIYHIEYNKYNKKEKTKDDINQTTKYNLIIDKSKNVFLEQSISKSINIIMNNCIARSFSFKNKDMVKVLGLELSMFTIMKYPEVIIKNNIAYIVNDYVFDNYYGFKFKFTEGGKFESVVYSPLSIKKYKVEEKHLKRHEKYQQPINSLTLDKCDIYKHKEKEEWMFGDENKIIKEKNKALNYAINNCISDDFDFASDVKLKILALETSLFRKLIQYPKLRKNNDNIYLITGDYFGENSGIHLMLKNGKFNKAKLESFGLDYTTKDSYKFNKKDGYNLVEYVKTKNKMPKFPIIPMKRFDVDYIISNAIKSKNGNVSSNEENCDSIKSITDKLSYKSVTMYFQEIKNDEYCQINMIAKISIDAVFNNVKKEEKEDLSKEVEMYKYSCLMSNDVYKMYILENTQKNVLIEGEYTVEEHILQKGQKSIKMYYKKTNKKDPETGMLIRGEKIEVNKSKLNIYDNPSICRII
jgi:hypothetical protein